jgi:hypothetical protein
MRLVLFGIEIFNIDFTVQDCCSGKVRYGHYATAERVVQAMNQDETTRRYLKVYRCEKCRGYHIGGRGT